MRFYKCLVHVYLQVNIHLSYRLKSTGCILCVCVCIRVHDRRDSYIFAYVTVRCSLETMCVEKPLSCTWELSKSAIQASAATTHTPGWRFVCDCNSHPTTTNPSVAHPRPLRRVCLGAESVSARKMFPKPRVTPPIGREGGGYRFRFCGVTLFWSAMGT